MECQHEGLVKGPGSARLTAPAIVPAGLFVVAEAIGMSGTQTLGRGQMSKRMGSKVCFRDVIDVEDECWNQEAFRPCI